MEYKLTLVLPFFELGGTSARTFLLFFYGLSARNKKSAETMAFPFRDYLKSKNRPFPQTGLAAGLKHRNRKNSRAFRLSLIRCLQKVRQFVCFPISPNEKQDKK